MLVKLASGAVVGPVYRTRCARPLALGVVCVEAQRMVVHSNYPVKQYPLGDWGMNPDCTGWRGRTRSRVGVPASTWHPFPVEQANTELTCLGSTFYRFVRDNIGVV